MDIEELISMDDDNFNSFCSSLNLSPEHVRDFIENCEGMEYVRFVPEFYAEHLGIDDAIITPD